MFSKRSENKLQIRKFCVFDFAGKKCPNICDPDFGKTSAVSVTTPLKTPFGKPHRVENDLPGRKKFASRSLTDLKTEHQQQKERKRTKSLTSDVRGNAEAVFGRKPFRQFPHWPETRNVNDAGRRVVNLLMLHAWRRRREDNEKARAVVATLTDQVDCLNMQVYVLRQLLNNEKNRVAIAAKDMQKNLLKIEEYKQERKLMLKEKESMESDIKYLQDLITDLKNKCRNQKNELATARLEAENWENRLKKERKKLKDLKDEKIILQKEAQSREDFLVFQSQNLEQLNQAIRELQDKLDAQVPLLNEAMSQVYSSQEKLKLSEEIEMKQQRALIQKDEEIKMLKMQIELVEEKLQEQDEKNGELKKLISDKTIRRDLCASATTSASGAECTLRNGFNYEENKELMLLNDKLREQNKSQKFWGNRVVKMASLCTRIPIACFYTVATLLLPQPSYRSF